MMSAPPRLRRRDLLVAVAIGGGAYAAAKVLFAWRQRAAADPLGNTRMLSPAHAHTLREAALTIAGPAARTALRAGTYDPLPWAEAMLAAMPAAQRGLAQTGLLLFEHWGFGWTGFSALPVDAQERRLAQWRTSRLALKRSVWGLLHAVGASAFAASEAGWRHMHYPGPCRGDVGYPGRPPGQSTHVVWDAIVP